MTVKDFKIGQRVAVIGGRHRSSAHKKTMATVARVGRKFVYVVEQGYTSETAFRARNEDEPYLVENIDCGTPLMLFPTEQAADDYTEHGDLLRWLADAARWPKYNNYTLEQLRAVKKILEGDSDA